jgi:MFS family permease
MSLPMTIPASFADVRHGDRRWWVLAIVVAAQFIFVVDAFIVNVAIPSIRANLGATTAEIQGVIVLYQIAFATLIITGGRLGDIRGPKRYSCSASSRSPWLRRGAASRARAASW